MHDTLPALPDHLSADIHTRFVLPDGRDLAFCAWGDPNGFPAFYFHGTPSCRLEGAFAHSAAQRHGVRLIAIDRPGVGRSTFQPNRNFSDWPQDVLALADHLSFDRFGVVGHSGAGPHLFACGALIAPARLAFIGALGPWGQLSNAEAKAGLNRLDRLFSQLAINNPLMMRLAFAPIGWTARHWSWLFMALLRSSVSRPDKHVLANASLADTFALVQKEAFRQGSQGAAHEALIAYQPWDFDIATVGVPTHIWLGEDDIFVPETMGRNLNQTIPGSTLRMVPGKGHFNIENWDDILSACRQHV